MRYKLFIWWEDTKTSLNNLAMAWALLTEAYLDDAGKNFRPIEYFKYLYSHRKQIRYFEYLHSRKQRA